MASRFAAITNKKNSQIIKQASVSVLFDLNLAMKLVKRFALLYLAELVISKLKTKFNSFFTEWF